MDTCEKTALVPKDTCLGQGSHCHYCSRSMCRSRGTSWVVSEIVEVWARQQDPNLGQSCPYYLEGRALTGTGPEVLCAVWRGEEATSKSKAGWSQSSQPAL